MLDAVGALAEDMRRRGARVGVGEVLAAHRALAAVDPADRAQAFHALRATLCCSRADLDAFALAFAALVASAAGDDPRLALGEVDPATAVPMTVPIGESFTGSRDVAAIRGGVGDDGAGRPLDLEPAPGAWSDDERLRERDFATYTDAERRAVRRLIARIAARAPRRRSRRMRPGRTRGHRPDLRATTRLSLRNGGELLERRWREPTLRPRRLVLILDVSGSMTPYARVLLQYVQASVAARARVEAFAFGTHLTRITRELGGRDPDAALTRAAERVTDWSGGTRIGESLATLNREHGRRIGRGAFVVLLSDGWDRGEPEVLGAELGRLRRTAHRLVWLNPLAADPRYQPLTRGMLAAMPHVDRLLPGNSLASLEQLAELMEEGG